MKVETDPAGARCQVDREGTHLGTIYPTPGSIQVSKSKNDLTIVCDKEQYQQAKLSHSSHFVGTTFGNIILGGVVGVVVDASTGANYTYPDTVKIPLAPVPVISAQPVPATGAEPTTAPNS